MAEPVPVILDNIGLGEFGPLSIPESSHGLCGGDEVGAPQVDLDPLAGIAADHVAGAPGSTILVHPDPNTC
jgi:hypothetical protein